MFDCVLANPHLYYLFIIIIIIIYLLLFFLNYFYYFLLFFFSFMIVLKLKVCLYVSYKYSTPHIPVTPHGGLKETYE